MVIEFLKIRHQLNLNRKRSRNIKILNMVTKMNILDIVTNKKKTLYIITNSPHIDNSRNITSIYDDNPNLKGIKKRSNYHP